MRSFEPGISRLLCFAEFFGRQNRGKDKQNSRMHGLKMRKKTAYCVIFIINTGQFSLKELPIYDNPLHSVSALNFAKALFKDIITFDF